MSANDLRKACGTCKHYNLVDVQDIKRGKGECLRFPPQFFMAPDPKIGFQPVCGYPQISRDTPACGEHVTKMTLDA
jgi:hypothetical protein